MTDLDLYKFIEESAMSTSLFDGKAIMWVYHFNVEEFAKLIGENILADGGIEVRFQHDTIAIDMTYICEYHDIDVEAVFKED
ncbi:MAG: hypothetical protein COB15_09610 [Flavobacteriales bacterium]|nr:MAG: hypothetical protein COB15_09610 [Flavobacteriales bacterium]